MSDLHISDFYKDASKILLQLYKNFPKKATVLVEDIAGPDNPDDFGLASERHQACFGAMIWLADSGYLQYAETIRQEALDQAILSHKAFTLLTATASGDEPADKNNIQCLRLALKSGSSDQLEGCMRSLLAQAHNFS